MDKLVTLGVAKGIKTAVVTAASKAVEQGKYEINALVHVQGTVEKCADEMVKPTTSLSTLETLALVLHHAGITRESAMNAIRLGVTDALTKDTKTKGVLTEKYDFIADQVKAIQDEVIEKLPKVPKSGKVLAKVEVTQVLPIAE